VYTLQKFSTKYNLGSIRNIFEVRSAKKIDRIGKDVKYLAPKVRKKMNYIKKNTKLFYIKCWANFNNLCIIA
jgi:hypothetical protein